MKVRRDRPRLLLAGICRKQDPFCREQARIEDVLVGRHRPQGLPGGRRIAEGHGRHAVVADDVGQHRDVAYEARSGGGVVVDGEDRAGDHEREAARRQHHRGQFSRH